MTTEDKYYIHEEIISRIGSYECVLLKVKSIKLSWFSHVSRHDTLANTNLPDRVEGIRKGVCPTMNWIDKSISGLVCLLDPYLM